MKKLDFKTKTAYGIGNWGYGTVSQTMNSFIMFFGTTVLGISGSLVGIAVAIATLWDGVSDPIVGYLSDKGSQKGFGKRINFMFVSSFAMAISNLLLWIIPSFLPMWVKFVWFLLALLLLESACTLFATPYFALGVDLAPDYSDQSALQGFKTVFFILGMIMPSLLMMVFMPTADGQFLQSGYIQIGIATSVLALFSGLVSSFGTVKVYKAQPFLQKKEKKQPFGKTVFQFFVVMKQKNFSSVVLGYSVALLSSAFLISVGMHLFTFAYHFSSGQISILMAVLFVSAIVSQGFWIYLSNRTDKKRALNLSLVTLLFGIGLTVITFMFREFVDNRVLFFMVCPCIFVCGFGTGSLYSLPISMFADVLTMAKMNTGEDNSATYSGFMTVAYNIANSLALLVIGFLLDFVKFNPKEPVQALSVQNGLGMIVFLGCGLSIALSILFFSKYHLKRTDILKAQMNYEKQFGILSKSPKSANIQANKAAEASIKQGSEQTLP